ncbi:hypothetical protein [Mycolicibacterium aichiense]|uniref:Uncharacterized protein n=1 Tax=Mycolicibacterium aichiense TaxID=1799 RepID=A0AAD1HQW5_9MYCO|nr:hypothetical protein [Mycolicibacterium aichiense]BBX10057.1 hypothetical protein MAIC_48600 [Mycolicibacterium aichiense]STZ26278.1 Uncharacterised protein [Mycolicibacterium aichiense]
MTGDRRRHLWSVPPPESPDDDPDPPDQEDPEPPEDETGVLLW